MARRGAGLQIVEVRSATGVCLRVKVSADVQAVLRAPEPPLRETPFADLSTAGPAGEVAPLDGDLLDGEIARRRIGQRHVPTGNPWSGPRHAFRILLGLARPGWNGMPCIDEFGRCGICRGRWLPPYAYCLACDRCGRDASLPTCPDHERPRVYRDDLKGGLVSVL
jgi:hypothetical protein